MVPGDGCGQCRVPPGDRAGRRGDHPGRALAYYGSRGETPLQWGDTRAARDLGLTGQVTPETYEAIYGPGGAIHPVTGERMANTKRPGFELVVSAHKSTAVLGVIGHADDMHSILNAETAGTMDWLNTYFAERGGRRVKRPDRLRRPAWYMPRPGTQPPGPETPALTTTS